MSNVIFVFLIFLCFYCVIFAWTRGNWSRKTYLIFSICISLAFLLIGLWGVWQQFSTYGWKPIQANILESDFHNDYIAKQTFHVLHLTYQYKLGDQIFTGKDNIVPEVDVANNYSQDKSVSVYYNPLRPAESVAMPGIRLDDNLFILMLLIALVLPIWAFYGYNWSKCKD